MLPESTSLSAEIVIKRSRFIARIDRVDSAEQARAMISEVRSAMPDARHHCTAFIVPSEGALPISRSSDDGEPSGTAGRPMLDVLAGVPLVGVVAVVTRYFGGTLLGTGGLVRAYSQAVREALEGARLVRREVVPVSLFTVSHREAGRYIAELSGRGCKPEVDYGDDGTHISVPSLDVESIEALVARLSQGAIAVEHGGEVSREVVCARIRDGRAAPLAQ